jgi:hypothetical protein
MDDSPRATLAALLEEHSALDARLRALDAFGKLLDPDAARALASEHDEFTEDLLLLDWLCRATPDSPDVAILTASLLRRLRAHVDRDGRLLARALYLSS